MHSCMPESTSKSAIDEAAKVTSPALILSNSTPTAHAYGSEVPRALTASISLTGQHPTTCRCAEATRAVACAARARARVRTTQMHCSSSARSSGSSTRRDLGQISPRSDPRAQRARGLDGACRHRAHVVARSVEAGQQPLLRCRSRLSRHRSATPASAR